MSEMLGFILGCFGFTFMCHAAQKPDWKKFALGTALLLVGVSARAGTFFIFPMLVLWVGWIFRAEKRFAWKIASLTFVSMPVGYFIVNSVYSRLLGIPTGSSFGNFSYALYGQVRGGMGWHSAIEMLGTRNPSIVYREALKFFLDHPLSLLIGFAKAYRDFFLVGDSSIFPFKSYQWQGISDILLWTGSIFLLIWGMKHLLEDIRSNHSSLLVAGFIGIFLSIPFLPPIDGGSRFYASTTPFFFVLPAVGASMLFNKKQKDQVLQINGSHDTQRTLSFLSLSLLGLTLILPLVLIEISTFNQTTVPVAPQCQINQEPFVIEMRPKSYIDLIVDNASLCRGVPNVCFDDFKSNNTEKTTDDFYQTLFALTETSKANARIIPAVNQLDNEFHYFYISHSLISDFPSSGMLTGCATGIKTQYQSIFKVESIQSETK